MGLIAQYHYPIEGLPDKGIDVFGHVGWESIVTVRTSISEVIRMREP